MAATEQAAQTETRHLTKMEKAAVILLCMDEKATGELFNQMEDDEIRKIAAALLKLNNIPTTQIQGVMQEFAKGLGASRVATTEMKINGMKAAENLLSKSLSRPRSQQILASLQGQALPTPEVETKFEDLMADLTPKVLFDLVGKEHPQVVAVALSNVKSKVARDVLQNFSEELQIDIISRMAKLEKISGRVMEELRNYLSQKIAERRRVPEKQEREIVDYSFEGLEGTLKILKSLNKEKSAKLIEEIEKQDADLAKEIDKRMFTMEDLGRASDLGIRELLRGMTNDDLKIGLKDMPDSLKEKFFKNMSERASMILKEDMSVMGPVKVEDMERAQSNILKVAKAMIKEGKLVLEEAPDDEG